MIESIFHWISIVFHNGVLVCYWINPFMMMFATCMWVVLHGRVRRELDRAYLRSYALEQQLDFLVNKSNLDMDFYNYMKKTYKDLEDKKRG